MIRVLCLTRPFMSPRPYISESKRQEIFERDRGKCFHCTKTLCFNNRAHGTKGAWHIEHLVPFSEGGDDSLRNLRAACINCNLEKGSKPLKEFDDEYQSRY